MTKNKKITFSIKNFRIHILGVVCGLLAIVSIFMTIESATSGAEVANIQKQEIALLDQKEELQNTLVQNLSTNSLQDKGNQLGFTKVDNLVYVSGGETVARLP
jgi:hypothetical protein